MNDGDDDFYVDSLNYGNGGEEKDRREDCLNY